MKRLALLLFILMNSLSAHAVLLNPSLRVAIKDACLQRISGPRALRFCGCVATRHFRSAKQMPDVARANHDLRWTLAYYRSRNAAGLERLRADPENLVAYDAFIGKQCRS